MPGPCVAFKAGREGAADVGASHPGGRDALGEVESSEKPSSSTTKEGLGGEGEGGRRQGKGDEEEEGRTACRTAPPVNQDRPSTSQSQSKVGHNKLGENGRWVIIKGQGQRALLYLCTPPRL